MSRLIQTGVLHLVILERHPQGDQLVQDCGSFMSADAVHFYVKGRFGEDATPCCANPHHLAWKLDTEEGDPAMLFIRADATELHTLVDGGTLN